MWQSCGCVFLCFFSVPSTMELCAEDTQHKLSVLPLVVTADDSPGRNLRRGLYVTLCVGRDSAHEDRLCVIESSMREWVLFWVGGDSEPPHINPWYFQFPSKFQEKSDPVIYCKVCWNRAKLPFWLRLLPPVLLYFLLKHKQGKIDSWNGKNLWCGLTNTGLGWGGGEPPSSSVCLKIKRPFQSTWGPAI